MAFNSDIVSLLAEDFHGNRCSLELGFEHLSKRPLS